MKRKIQGIENYSSKWIAVDEKKSKVLYSADTYKELLKTLKDVKEEVFLMKLPSFKGSFTP